MEQKVTGVSWVVSIFMGVCLGLGAFVLPFSIFIQLLGAIGIAVLIFWKVEIGVFLVIGLTPLLPTKFVMALVAITLISLLFRLVVKKDLHFRLTWTDGLVILFGLIMLYGSIISFTPKSSLTTTALHILFMSFYFIASKTIKTKGQLHCCIVILVVSAALVSLLGIYQNYVGIPGGDAWVDKEMFEDIKVRVVGTFENPNVLGEFLVMVLPMGVALMLTRKKLAHGAAFFLMNMIMLICLLLSYSRGSYLGILLAFGIFAVLKDKRLLGLGVGGIVLVPVLLPSILNRFSSIGNLQDTSSAYRVSIWLGSIRIIKDFWSIGIGVGTQVFETVYRKYALSASYALHAHNLYLQILVEVGIIGFILFSAILFMFYKLVATSIRVSQDNFIRTFSIALGAGTVGYLFQGLVDNIWYNYRVLLMFWILLAFAAVVKNLSTSVEGIEQ